MNSVIAIAALIAAIGGGAWALGKPPYANQTETVSQIAGLQLQYQQTKEQQLQERLFDLRLKARNASGSSRAFIEQEINRLEFQLRQIQQSIEQQLRK